MTAPFSSIQVKMVPENVTVDRADRPAARDGRSSRSGWSSCITAMRSKTAAGEWRDARSDPLDRGGFRRPQRGEAPVSEGRRLKLLLASPDDRSAACRSSASRSMPTKRSRPPSRCDDSGSYVQVARVDPNPQALRASQPKPTRTTTNGGGMELYDSLYETALKQNIPKPVIDDLVRVFGNDVDFQRGVAGGDTLRRLLRRRRRRTAATTCSTPRSRCATRPSTTTASRHPDDGAVDYLRRERPLDPQVPDPQARAERRDHLGLRPAVPSDPRLHPPPYGRRLGARRSARRSWRPAAARC